MPRRAHDAIALGPPCVLSTWAFDLLREVCALVPDRAAVRAIDREDPLEPDGDRAPLIYLSHFPSPPLQAQCGEGTAPILLCLDDPADSVRYLQQGGTGSVVEALRLQTAAAAFYAQLRGNPRLLILHRLADAPCGELLDAILDHLGLELAPEHYDMVHRKRLGPKGKDSDLESSLQFRVDGYEPLEDAQTRFTPKEIAMIGGVLSPLIQMSFRESAGSIVWPTEAFLSGDRPDTPASLVADLTGAARILYYGPYFYLPVGSWSVRMMVGFSAGARRTPFSVEVFGGRLLAHATMVPEAKGVYHASFGFTHHDASQPVEVRVRTDHGAIEGRLAFGNVEFSLDRFAG
jgi:hypothetical protein